MNLQAKWIELLNPIYIKNESKRKNIQIIIFFSITFGLTYILGLILYFREYIDPENFAGFMMILPLSSVSIAKFYTEGRTNDNYKFYSLVILFFICYLLLFIIRSLNLINDNKFITINSILIFISSVSALIYSTSLKDLYLIKNIKIGAILIVYFMLTKIIPITFSLLIQGNQPNYDGLLIYIFVPITSLISIYYFLGEEYGWRGFLQDIFFVKFGKKLGVILLGICWSLWHLPLHFTLYSPKTPILGTAVHVIYVVGISIFLGYVYMKTKNVWFCAIIHALNNSAFIIATYDINYESITTYSDIVESLFFVSLVYVPFLFTKEYKESIKKE